MVSSQMIEDHINKLVEVIHGIKMHRLTILVGANRTGKSLVRKQMSYPVDALFDDNRSHVRSISMQLRTESRSDFGALSSATHDSPYNPTSLTSRDLLCKLMKEPSSEHYYIIDEIEIGMSEESVLGIADIIRENIEEWVSRTLGVLLITHSPVIVRELCSLDCDFINLGYNMLDYDINAWLNRKIVATDFDFLSEWSSALFDKLQKDFGRY